MPRNTELITERNQRIRNRFKELCEKHPQWRYDAILEQISREFYITTSTIAKIINHD